MKKLILSLLLLVSTSCVTKVQTINVYNYQGEQEVEQNVLQQGSRDALNGNKGELDIPIP